MKQEKNAKIGRWKAGLLAALMCVGVTVAYAQQVKGTVLDENGEPIIGANVVEKGTTNGMVTDLMDIIPCRCPMWNMPFCSFLTSVIIRRKKL